MKENYSPITLTIDGEDIVLGLKHLNFQEGTWFRENYRRLNNPIHEKHIFRKPDEQEKDEKGNFLIEDDEIEKRRVGEMSVEGRKEFEREVDADLDFRVRIVSNVFEKFVKVESWPSRPNETEGVAFLNAHGSRWELCVQILSVFWIRCVLGDREKKVSQLVIDSFSFSAGLAKARAGTKRKTVAGGAAPSTSASSEDVSDQAADPSGSTDPASSKPVPSLN